MAVYTKLSPEDISGFLTRYNVGPLASAEGIQEGIENTNYLLAAGPKRYILTLFEQRVQENELPFFLGLTEWLHDKGIPCPRPIPAKDGAVIQELKGKKAALIEFLEGSNKTPITPSHLSEMGKIAAKMHLAARDFPARRENTMGFAAWRHLYQAARPRLDEISPGLAREMEQELIFLEEHWPRDLPAGIVHADLFPDNIFFKDEKISGVIDFYFACHDFWMYDLLICMNAWCFDEKHRFVQARARIFWDAYQQIRPLTEEEREAAVILARGACVRFLATRAYDWLNTPRDAVVTRKDPMEYVAKLRFHRQVQSAAEYGI